MSNPRYRDEAGVDDIRKLDGQVRMLQRQLALASGGLLAPRKIKQWDGAHGSGTVAQSLILLSNGQSSIAPATASARPLSVFTYTASRFDIPGFVAQYAIHVQGARNAVAPGGNWIWAPWEVTSLGGLGAISTIGYTMAAAFKTGPRYTHTGWSVASIDSWGNQAAVVTDEDDLEWRSAAGWGWVDGDVLAMAVNNASTTATNSYSTYTIELWMRWVPI